MATLVISRPSDKRPTGFKQQGARHSRSNFARGIISLIEIQGRANSSRRAMAWVNIAFLLIVAINSIAVVFSNNLH